MNKVSNLGAELADLEAQLEAAQEKYRVANLAIAKDAGNAEARTTARGAAQVIADIEGDIQLLNDARAAALAEDRSDRSIARKREAAAHFAAAEKLIESRNKVASELDAALFALHSASKDWAEVNDELGQRLRGGFAFTLEGASESVLFQYRSLVSGLGSYGINGYLMQLDMALRAAGIPRNMAELNCIGNPDVRESIAHDIQKQNKTILGYTDAASVAAPANLSKQHPPHSQILGGREVIHAA